MQRYFVNEENFMDQIITITGDDVHHISKVIRLKIGDKIICSNGRGLDYLTEITMIESGQIICRIINKMEENRESEIEVILAQGLPKADKMDLIIQKGTEIGVSSFLPYTSERTIVQLDEKKELKKLERWNKIAKEAAEQSHRSIIPKVLPVLTFKQLLNYIEGKFALIAYEKESTKSLYGILDQNLNIKQIILIIGPEGGFTEKEVVEAMEHGFISFSLGKRILRTETAGLVAASNIFYHYENFGKKQ